METKRYPWPASRLGPLIGTLHAAREATEPRVPITRLIERAVIIAYGDKAAELNNEPPDQEAA